MNKVERQELAEYAERAIGRTAQDLAQGSNVWRHSTAEYAGAYLDVLESEQARRCLGYGEETHCSALVEHAERGHTRPLTTWSNSMLHDELRNIAHALQADDGEHYDSLMSQDRMVRNEITFRGAVSSF